MPRVETEWSSSNSSCWHRELSWPEKGLGTLGNLSNTFPHCCLHSCDSPRRHRPHPRSFHFPCQTPQNRVPRAQGKSPHPGSAQAAHPAPAAPAVAAAVAAQSHRVALRIAGPVHSPYWRARWSLKEPSQESSDADATRPRGERMAVAAVRLFFQAEGTRMRLCLL